MVSSPYLVQDEGSPISPSLRPIYDNFIFEFQSKLGSIKFRDCLSSLD